MITWVVTIDNDVIQVGHAEDIEVFSKRVVDVSLDGHRCPGGAEGHYQEFVECIPSVGGCSLFFSLPYSCEHVCIPHFYFNTDCGFSYTCGGFDN